MPMIFGHFAIDLMGLASCYNVEAVFANLQGSVDAVGVELPCGVGGYRGCN